jgi:hypothetical protein
VTAYIILEEREIILMDEEPSNNSHWYEKSRTTFNYFIPFTHLFFLRKHHAGHHTGSRDQQ